MNQRKGLLTLIVLCIGMFVVEGAMINQKRQSILGKQMNEQKTVEKQLKKPQEPEAPRPYHVEEVEYKNGDAGIVLAGTLSVPYGQRQFPAVLLIAGYGPQDRDASGMGHKYFLVLADYLTRQGIAVLRVDKRGVGKSSGIYETATSYDFASDVMAGISYLKTRAEINPNQIGLAGLSEGGLIASIVAAESKDVAFVALMAPAVISKTEDLVTFSGLQLRADGASESFIERDRKVRTAIYTIVKQESDMAVAEDKAHSEIERYLADLPEELNKEAEKLPFAFTEAKKDVLVKTFNSPWYRFFLKYDSASVLRKIQVPVLAINGNRDWIATPDKVFSVLNDAFEASGNKDYTLVELENLNHCFQTCQTGALMEYATINETMAPIAMKTIADWILAKQS